MQCRWMAGCTLLVLVAGSAGAQAPPVVPAKPEPKPPTSAEASEAVQQLLLELREARGVATSLPDGLARRRLELLLDRIELKARRLGDMAAAAAALPTTAPKVPLAKPEFDKLLAALKREAFDDGRFALLRVSVEHGYFTAEQGKALVATFKFSDGQKRAAVLLYQRLTDPGNVATLLGALPFDSDRKDVLRAIGKP